MEETQISRTKIKEKKRRTSKEPIFIKKDNSRYFWRNIFSNYYNVDYLVVKLKFFSSPGLKFIKKLKLNIFNFVGCFFILQNFLSFFSKDLD